MLTFAVESLEHIMASPERELALMFSAHHKEQVGQDYEADMDMYISVERLGLSKCIVAREDGVAVGYCIVFVHKCHQRKGFRVGEGDAYYVSPGHKSPLVGLLMMRWVVDYLKDEGAQEVRFMSSMKCDTSKLLERFGFKPSAVIYSLDIGAA